MDIILSNSSDKPIYEQIASQVKAQILSGTLAAGAKLPSIRALASDLGVSVITTKRAYEILEQEKLIESYTGRGSFVSAQDPALLREQSLREAEQYLSKAADTAKRCGVSYDELAEILKMFME